MAFLKQKQRSNPKIVDVILLRPWPGRIFEPSGSDDPCVRRPFLRSPVAIEVFEHDEEEAIEPPPRVGEEAVRPACPGCGYDLAGTLELEPQRCPECGREWTLEELALQHLAQSNQEVASMRLATAVGPGLTIGFLLFIGLLFGPPVLWLTWPVAGLAALFAIVEWARDYYRRSFALARGRMNRLAYVAARTGLLVIVNGLLIGAGGLLVLLAIVAWGA